MSTPDEEWRRVSRQPDGTAAGDAAAYPGTPAVPVFPLGNEAATPAAGMAGQYAGQQFAPQVPDPQAEAARHELAQQQFLAQQHYLQRQARQFGAGSQAYGQGTMPGHQAPPAAAPLPGAGQFPPAAGQPGSQWAPGQAAPDVELNALGQPVAAPASPYQRGLAAPGPQQAPGPEAAGAPAHFQAVPGTPAQPHVASGTPAPYAHPNPQQQPPPQGYQPAASAPGSGSYAQPDLSNARFLQRQGTSAVGETPPVGAAVQQAPIAPVPAPAPAPSAFPNPGLGAGTWPAPQPAARPAYPDMQPTDVMPQQPSPSPVVRTPAAAARVRTLDTNTGGISALRPVDLANAEARSGAPAPISGPIMRPQIAESEPSDLSAAPAAQGYQPVTGAKAKGDIEQTGSKVMKVIMVILIVAVIGFAIYLLVTQPGGMTNSIGTFGFDIHAASHIDAAAWGQVGSA